MTQSFLYFMKFVAVSVFVIFLCIWGYKFFPQSTTPITGLLFFIQYKIFSSKETSPAYKIATTAFIIPLTVIFLIAFAYYDPSISIPTNR